MTQDKPTSTRGFASMDKEKQRQIARKGGEAAHGTRDRSRDPDKSSEGQG